ncbi:predicted protein [Coccidioides posadasii str. Silveira]|uniref:Predicted protein n=1 Tax=Coccidioides posadasii (strain RMSCC 757 / Silveira) TaxID=443226 RepID=E9DDZ1_COCPS|nr:predicted protein [Coccidioides posadasii str. Silveira]
MEINMWVFYFVSCHSSDARMSCIFRIHLYASGSIIRPFTSFLQGIDVAHQNPHYMETPRRQSLTRVPSSTGNAKPSLHFPLHPTPRPDLDTPPPGYYLILLIVIALSFRH